MFYWFMVNIYVLLFKVDLFIFYNLVFGFSIAKIRKPVNVNVFENLFDDINSG